MGAHPRSKTVFVSAWAMVLSMAAGLPSVLAQSGLPYLIEPPEGSVKFGWSVASGGDVNGDGVDDLFISDPGFEVDGVRVGRWFVYDGLTRAVVWSDVGDEYLGSDQRIFAYSIPAAFIGDIDGDGRDDLIVGRPVANDSLGVAEVYSGSAGDVLYRFDGASNSDLLGVDVAGVGDMNNDDVPDFAVVMRYWDDEEGRVSFRSGRDGSELFQIVAPFPRRVRGIGDRDGDGYDDAIIGTFGGNDPQINIISGRIGETTTIHPPGGPNDVDFGYALAGGFDLTGDDVPDFIVKNGRNWFMPVILVFSGATLEIVNTIEAGEDSSLFGIELDVADVNNDGSYEVVTSDVYRIRTYEPLTGRLLHWTLRSRGGAAWYGNETAIGDFNGDGFVDFAGPLNESGVMLYGGGPLLLSLSELQRDFNLARGATHSFAVFGAQPGRKVHFLASLIGNGCTFISQLGICIDLDRRIYRLGSTITRSDGFAQLNVEIGPNMPPGTAWVQAIDVADPNRGPITSNVMVVEIVE